MLVHIIIGWQATLPILRFGTDVPESAGLVQTSTPYLPKDWEQGVDGLQTGVGATSRDGMSLHDHVTQTHRNVL